MKKRDRFHHLFPGHYFLDAEDAIGLTKYLDAIGFLQENEMIQSTSIPGAGNMNYVLRVTSNHRSFIIKQARPWVEKYDVIEAPVNRIEVETTFYQSLRNHKNLIKQTPKLYHTDLSNFLMIIEDLGAVEDFTYLYSEDNKILSKEVEQLARFLSQLHRLSVPNFPKNMEMRILNHQHIFEIPFSENNNIALDDIQQGLQSLQALVVASDELQSAIKKLGDIYLASGDVLLHGDFYPGSWVNTGNEIYIIDPEFSFKGKAEFDLGVFIAHMYMAKQDESLIQDFFALYTSNKIDHKLVYAFAGIEIIRRLLGVAQLPISLTVQEKKELIILGKQWIVKN